MLNLKKKKHAGLENHDHLLFFVFQNQEDFFFNGVNDIFSWTNNVLSPATIPSY